MATDYGRRLAAARKRAGLTQKQLAPKVGMSQSNLSELETVAFESGKTAQIAHACGVNAYWLATGEGDMLAGVTAQTPVSQRPDLAAALPVVLEALAALTPGKWDMVRARLGALPGRPEAMAEVLGDVAPVLGLQRQLGAPIAAEHAATLQALSDLAEAQHAVSAKRRRPAGG